MTDFVPKPAKLYRSRTDRKIAGVCGGLGEFFGIDSTFVRLFFILLFFLGGASVLAYVVLWLIVPEQPIA